MAEKVIVVKEHRPDPGDVLTVFAGDELDFVRKETTFKGWLWCTDHKGVHAWVPEAYVAIDGTTCRMLRDYNSRELTAAVGDCVEVLETESGWAWVLDRACERGWLPLECLQRMASGASPK